MISVYNVKLPNKSLSNFQLIDAAKALKIPYFRGVFMRDKLPKKPYSKECGILNLDDFTGNGTHWVAWHKNGKEKFYFDSFGLIPPDEIVAYLKSPIRWNTERVQPDDQVFCGHLCLYVLKRLSEGKNLQVVVNNLY